MDAKVREYISATFLGAVVGGVMFFLGWMLMIAPDVSLGYAYTETSPTITAVAPASVSPTSTSWAITRTLAPKKVKVGIFELNRQIWSAHESVSWAAGGYSYTNGPDVKVASAVPARDDTGSVSVLVVESMAMPNLQAIHAIVMPYPGESSSNITVVPATSTVGAFAMCDGSRYWQSNKASAVDYRYSWPRTDVPNTRLMPEPGAAWAPMLSRGYALVVALRPSAIVGKYDRAVVMYRYADAKAPTSFSYDMQRFVERGLTIAAGTVTSMTVTSPLGGRIALYADPLGIGQPVWTNVNDVTPAYTALNGSGSAGALHAVSSAVSTDAAAVEWAFRTADVAQVATSSVSAPTGFDNTGYSPEVSAPPTSVVPTSGAAAFNGSGNWFSSGVSQITGLMDWLYAPIAGFTTIFGGE